MGWNRCSSPVPFFKNFVSTSSPCVLKRRERVQAMTIKKKEASIFYMLTDVLPYSTRIIHLSFGRSKQGLIVALDVNERSVRSDNGKENTYLFHPTRTTQGSQKKGFLPWEASHDLFQQLVHFDSVPTSVVHRVLSPSPSRSCTHDRRTLPTPTRVLFPGNVPMKSIPSNANVCTL